MRQIENSKQVQASIFNLEQQAERREKHHLQEINKLKREISILKNEDVVDEVVVVEEEEEGEKEKGGDGETQEEGVLN